jgi:MFS family permease
MSFFQNILIYFREMGQINRNCALVFSAASLNGLAHGIFMVVFNLYILSLGIPPDILGAILSAGPFAQALGSIPVGFLMEKIGFKKVFLLIYGINGLAKIVQVSTPFVGIIAAASFIGGLALAGDFVTRLPFLAANSKPEDRTRIYSLNSILFSISMSVGALVAGFAPTLVQTLGVLDLTTSYQWLLYFGCLLSLAALIPCMMITEQPRDHARKISLKPYLWGMDRFTVQQAVVSLFVGLAFGLTGPFMNIYFLYHLGTTREFFGTISALAIIPALIATSFGPLLGARFGPVRMVSVLRSANPLFLSTLALTSSPWLGTLAHWLQNAFSTAAQPLSFAFGMRVARPSAKSAVSAWLNVTFWLGNAAAAPLAGAFLAQEQYPIPLFIAAGSMLASGLLNEIFFRRIESALREQEV